MLVTKLIKQAFAFYTKLSLKGVLRIVDAGVNYFTIPATSLEPKGAVLFKDENSFFSCAISRAVARPITPAPMIATSISTSIYPFGSYS